MSGLLIAALTVGCAALTIWLLVKVRPLWGKATVLVAIILIPVADELYYRRQLDAYCKTEAGFYIYEQASRRAGIVDNTMFGIDYMKSYPLDIVETEDRAGKEPHRFERQADGSIKEIRTNKISVPYELVYTETNTGTFLETKMAVVVRQTGKVLGKRTDLNYYGGWIRRRLLGTIAASGPTLVADCGIGSGFSRERYRLIDQVFTQD